MSAGADRGDSPRRVHQTSCSPLGGDVRWTEGTKRTGGRGKNPLFSLPLLTYKANLFLGITIIDNMQICYFTCFVTQVHYGYIKVYIGTDQSEVNIRFYQEFIFVRTSQLRGIDETPCVSSGVFYHDIFGGARIY